MFPPDRCVAGSCEAIRSSMTKVSVRLVKIKSCGPGQARKSVKPQKCQHIIVPEFNVTGGLAKEIRATIPNSERVNAGPRVCGGMTMPPEIIVSEIKNLLGMRTCRWPVAAVDRTYAARTNRPE